MPLPLLFIAIAAGTGALGVGKTIKAGVDTHKAKKTNESANELVASAKERLTLAREKSGESLQNLGKTKATLLSTSITDFVNVFETIKHVDFQKSAGLHELSKFKIDKQSFEQLKEMGGFATSILGGVGGGALGGALTAFGAYSAAGSLAAASTGTAIASLSGAAATNATLAFFGGGSIAAGGLGVAGGTAVLGGLVAGPALAIMGVIVGAKASKAKDEALANYAKAEKIADELDVATMLCNAISKRAKLFMTLLNELDKRFQPVILSMKEVIAKCGNDYRNFPEEGKATIAAAASLAGTIKAVIDTPILTEDGQLTVESLDMYRTIKAGVVSNDGRGIIEIFTDEDRKGFVGHLSFDTIDRAAKLCSLPKDNYVLYLNVCHHYGSAYFVITTEAIAYSHENGRDVEQSYYIPFSSIKAIDVSMSNDTVEGLAVTYSENGDNKGVLFTCNEIGDNISESYDRAKYFASLLEQAIILSRE